MTDQIKSFITNNLNQKITADQINITKIFGQASARQYFRATIKDSQSPRANSFVIMQLPQGFSSPAEEVTKTGKEAPQEFPFLNIQRYLNNHEIPVPQILAFDDNQGLILLEDLGDTSFEKLIRNAEGGFLTFYYKKAIELLVEMQNKTLADPNPNCTAFHRSFDEDLLQWEFYHFVEYGIEDRKQIKLPNQDKEKYINITKSISQTITNMPQGFVHRDYQSRNIMFHNFNFYLIDFQDALTGPLLYDLVALLRDSYSNINPEQLHSLTVHYAELLPETHPYHSRKNNILTDFHLIALQRKLKDAGRFQYIHTVKNNPNFLKNVPQSLHYVKEALDHLLEHGPQNIDFKTLRHFLTTHVEDF